MDTVSMCTIFRAQNMAGNEDEQMNAVTSHLASYEWRSLANGLSSLEQTRSRFESSDSCYVVVPSGGVVETALSD